MRDGGSYPSTRFFFQKFLRRTERLHDPESCVIAMTNMYPLSMKERLINVLDQHNHLVLAEGFLRYICVQNTASLRCFSQNSRNCFSLANTGA